MSTAPSALPLLTPASHRVIITDWRVSGKNTLIGSFTVQLPSGMMIDRCMVHRERHNTGYWVALPGTVQIDSAGKVKSAGDGRPIYKTLIRFATKALYDRFQGPILEELKRLGFIA